MLLVGVMACHTVTQKLRVGSSMGIEDPTCFYAGRMSGGCGGRADTQVRPYGVHL